MLHDLTLPIPAVTTEKMTFDGSTHTQETVRTELWRLPRGGQAAVYYLHHWGMAGTYIDFPGHLVETDDGTDAANYPADKLYRVPARVARLNRAGGSGKIGVDELRAAVPPGPAGGALILNALGARRFDDVPTRSVYLAREAVEWIASTGIHLLVSDVYESNDDPQDVFRTLFAAHVCTVCCPINMDRIGQDRVRVTALPMRYPGVTQLPCRVLVEEPDPTP